MTLGTFQALKLVIDVWNSLIINDEGMDEWVDGAEEWQLGARVAVVVKKWVEDISKA